MKIAVSLLAAVLTLAAAGMSLASTCNPDDTEITDDIRAFSVVNVGLERDTFEDIGCAVMWRDELCAHEIIDFDANALVHDYESGESVRMTKAFFVRGSRVREGGYDIVAFTDAARAEEFARAHGAQVMDFNQLTTVNLVVSR
jgi:nitrous oxide reductase accessory protein NosL